MKSILLVVLLTYIVSDESININAPLFMYALVGTPFFVFINYLVDRLFPIRGVYTKFVFGILFTFIFRNYDQTMTTFLIRKFIIFLIYINIRGNGIRANNDKKEETGSAHDFNFEHIESRFFYLVAISHSIYTSCVYLAATKGDLNAIKYIYSIGGKINSNAAILAARNGHLDCLKYFNSINMPITERSIIDAATQGEHNDCIEYLHSIREGQTNKTISNRLPLAEWKAHKCGKK